MVPRGDREGDGRSDVAGDVVDSDGRLKPPPVDPTCQGGLEISCFSEGIAVPQPRQPRQGVALAGAASQLDPLPRADVCRRRAQELRRRWRVCKKRRITLESLIEDARRLLINS